MLYWMLFGLVVGALAAYVRKFHLLAGAAGGALLGPLALLLFFVSSAGGGKNAGRQVGRGVLIGVGIVVLALAALVAYFRLGGAQ